MVYNMKIAMIGQKGIAVGAGGVEKHVEEIASRLVEKGHEVTVYYRNTFISEDINEYKGIKLKKIKTIKNKSLDAIIYTFKATIDALKDNYDIYHYHALGPASLSFIPKLFGKKVIVTVHGLDWKRDKWGKFARLYLKFGEKVTGRFSDYVISVSENIKDYFINKYDKRNNENTVYVPNGVTIEGNIEADLIKSRYGLEKNKYILFLARLVPEKGAHYLINAFKRIKNDNGIKLVIAGGSSFTDSYENKLKKLANNDENIIFTGNVSGKLLKELYSNCMLYTLPSDIEGMPITLLEAMSYSRYVVVSDIKENTNVIKNCNVKYIFKKGDIDDLYFKLVNCIDYGKEHDYCCNEYLETVKRDFNWDSVIDKDIMVYEKALNNGAIK